jgi:hypothetical protein
MAKPPVPVDRHSVIPAAEVRERAGILSVFSSQERKGPWTLPRELRVACILGSVELDLREARIPEGHSVIEVFCILGSVELLVPSGIHVEVEGDAFAGGVTFQPDAAVVPPPDAPRITLRGTTWFGSVECEARLAGEGKRAAQKRLKAARSQAPPSR